MGYKCIRWRKHLYVSGGNCFFYQDCMRRLNFESSSLCLLWENFQQNGKTASHTEFVRRFFLFVYRLMLTLLKKEMNFSNHSIWFSYLHLDNGEYCVLFHKLAIACFAVTVFGDCQVWNYCVQICIVWVLNQHSEDAGRYFYSLLVACTVDTNFANSWW